MVPILVISYISESILDLVLQILHVNGLEFHQPEFNFAKVGHFDAELPLDVLACDHELIKSKDSLRFGFDDLLHTVKVIVDSLHYHIFVALHIDMHDLKLGWEARLNPIGDVFEIRDELFTDL